MKDKKFLLNMRLGRYNHYNCVFSDKRIIAKMDCKRNSVVDDMWWNRRGYVGNRTQLEWKFQATFNFWK